MTGSFVESIENMFEVLLFITAIFMLRFLLVGRSREEYDETEEEFNLDRLKATEIEIEQISGIWYAWIKDPEDGYQYVGQSNSKDTLTTEIESILRKRYTPVD